MDGRGGETGEETGSTDERRRWRGSPSDLESVRFNQSDGFALAVSPRDPRRRCIRSRELVYTSTARTKAEWTSPGGKRSGHGAEEGKGETERGRDGEKSRRDPRRLLKIRRARRGSARIRLPLLLYLLLSFARRGWARWRKELNWCWKIVFGTVVAWEWEQQARCTSDYIQLLNVRWRAVLSSGAFRFHV